MNTTNHQTASLSPSASAENDESQSTESLQSKELGVALTRLRGAPNRLLLGIVLMLISGGLGSLLLRSESATIEAVRATTDLAAGVEVQPQDIESVWLPQRLAGDWLKRSDLASGTLSSPVKAGQLLYQGDLVDWQEARPTFSLSLNAADLPAGIRVGDDVQLWSGSADGATLLAAAANVRALELDEASGQWALTLAVEPPLIGELLTAIANDGLRVVGSA